MIAPLMAVTGIDVFETIRINPPCRTGMLQFGKQGAARGQTAQWPAMRYLNTRLRQFATGSSVATCLKWPFSACRAGSTGLMPASGLLQISFLQSHPRCDYQSSGRCVSILPLRLAPCRIIHAF